MSGAPLRLPCRTCEKTRSGSPKGDRTAQSTSPLPSGSAGRVVVVKLEDGLGAAEGFYSICAKGCPGGSPKLAPREPICHPRCNPR